MEQQVEYTLLLDRAEEDPWLHLLADSLMLVWPLRWESVVSLRQASRAEFEHVNSLHHLSNQLKSHILLYTIERKTSHQQI